MILFETIAQEDRSAFEAMYLRERGDLFRAAMRILRDRGLAEDAVHDVFLRAAKIFDRLVTQTPREQRRYLLSSVRFRALDILRERRSDLPLIEETAVAPEPDVGLTDLERLIALLPRADAEVLRLRYLDGMTVGETAKLLRVSPAAVQKRVERAKEKLKKILIENGYGDYFDE